MVKISQGEVGKTSRGTVKFSHRHDCVEQVWEKVSWTFVKKLFVSLECDPMFLWKNCPIFLAKLFQCENREHVNDFCELSKNDFQFWQIFFHPPYFQERASDHIHGHKEEDLVNCGCACLDILLFCSLAIVPGTWHLSCEFTQLELHSWFSWWNSGSPRWILLVSLPQTLSWSAPPRYANTTNFLGICTSRPLSIFSKIQFCAKWPDLLTLNIHCQFCWTTVLAVHQINQLWKYWTTTS